MGKFKEKVVVVTGGSSGIGEAMVRKFSDEIVDTNYKGLFFTVQKSVRLLNPNASLKNVPLKRFASPDEIAQAAMYLSSDEGGYITGIDLIVDGGMTAVYPLNH